MVKPVAANKKYKSQPIGVEVWQRDEINKAFDDASVEQISAVGFVTNQLTQK